MIAGAPDVSKTREKISPEFLFDKALNGFPNSRFSLSVTPKTKNTGFPGIDEYLLLGTEFGSNPVNVTLWQKGQ